MNGTAENWLFIKQVRYLIFTDFHQNLIRSAHYPKASIYQVSLKLRLSVEQTHIHTDIHTDTLTAKIPLCALHMGVKKSNSLIN